MNLLKFTWIFTQYLYNSVPKLDSEIVFFKAQDSKKDIKTNTCSISIPDSISLPQTGNFPVELK